MPMQPHSRAWGTLLLACSVHNNVEFGEIAAQRRFDLEPNATAFILFLPTFIPLLEGGMMSGD